MSSSATLKTKKPVEKTVISCGCGFSQEAIEEILWDLPKGTVTDQVIFSTAETFAEMDEDLKDLYAHIDQLISKIITLKEPVTRSSE